MPVPLSTIKAALKVSYTEDDSELLRLRSAAAELVEKETGRRLAPTALTLWLPGFVDTLIPVAPVMNVGPITYTTGGAVQTLSGTKYWIDKTDGPMWWLRFIEAPEFDDGTAVEVQYTAGASEVPAALQHALIAIIGHWYNNPEAVQPLTLTETPLSVRYILQLYSVRSAIR